MGIRSQNAVTERLIRILRTLTQPRRDANNPQATGLLPVRSAEQLLAQGARPTLLRQIDRLLSFPTAQLETLFRSAIIEYARLVQQ
ncbi:MAG: hypothetical protein GY759_13920 [Chloroflexi bacterium]|nr:hypothetical protein [Chloroflexota bacterium]